MVVPYDVAVSAQDAVADRVIAWLDSGGDVNDVDQDGFTLLNRVACGGTRSARIGPKHVTLARHLLACGANVNSPVIFRGRLSTLVVGRGGPLDRAVRKYGGTTPCLRSNGSQCWVTRARGRLVRAAGTVVDAPEYVSIAESFVVFPCCACEAEFTEH